MNPSLPLVYRLLTQLDAAKIHYTLNRVREETIMIVAAVPGRRYEIEVFEDDHVEVEIFSSEGISGGQEVIDELLANYSDNE